MDTEISKLITRGVFAIQFVSVVGLWLLALAVNFNVWLLTCGIAGILSIGLYLVVFAKHFK